MYYIKQILIKKFFCILLIITMIFLIVYMVFNLVNKKLIDINCNGKNMKVVTLKSTVKDVLIEQGTDYKDDDIIKPSLSSKVKNASEIKIIKVSKKIESNFEFIPFKTKVIKDSNLKKGTTMVLKRGEVGKKNIKYILTYHNKDLVKKIYLEESLIKQPIDRIVKIGTKIIYCNLKDNISNSGNKMTVVATAYTGDSITSTGKIPRWGIIAVDPKLIPYGSIVYIPDFKMNFKAEDCGGAIKGNRIDIFMNGNSNVQNWGKRSITIYVKN